MDIEDEAVIEEEMGTSRRGLHRVGVTLGAAVVFGVVVYLTNNFFRAKPLEEYKQVETIEIKKDDTYSHYAANILKTRPCMKGVGIERMAHYLRYNVNGGAGLIEGRKVNLPVYNCTK